VAAVAEASAEEVYALRRYAMPMLMLTMRRQVLLEVDKDEVGKEERWTTTMKVKVLQCRTSL